MDVICDFTAIGIDPESTVSVDLERVPLKQALDTLFKGHLVEYGSDKNTLLIGSASSPPKNSHETMSAFRTAEFHRGSLLGPYGSVVALIAVGLFAGFFSVPLQVYLQTAAPDDQKGRIIGAWNLLNWIGIAGSGIVYSLGRQLLVGWLELPHAALFGFAAVPDAASRTVLSTTRNANRKSGGIVLLQQAANRADSRDSRSAHIDRQGMQL